MSFKSVLADLSKDGHVATGIFVFCVGSVLHYFKGLDASFVAFSTTVLGFLGGHAWVQSQSDQPQQPQQPQAPPPPPGQ
jgi:hypothetical protein